jgi:sugar lactone lactonase YvrE
MHDAAFSTVLGGLVFPEGLRWRRDRLWFTDVEDRRVYCCDANGIVLVAFETPNHPVGLGWDTTGTLLISTLERRLLRYDGRSVDDGVDLGRDVPHNGNDLVVDAYGRAYYGSVGAPMDRPSEFEGAGSLVLIEPDGATRVVADGLSFPNGMVLTADGATLILAESVGRRLTRFAVAADGSLYDRAVFAELDTIPDGICLDAEGAVWIACPTERCVQRVREGGAVAARHDTGRTVARRRTRRRRRPHSVRRHVTRHQPHARWSGTAHGKDRTHPRRRAGAALNAARHSRRSSGAPA